MNITHSCIYTFQLINQGSYFVGGKEGGVSDGRGAGSGGRGRASENDFQGNTSVTDLFSLYLAPIINVYGHWK